MNDKDILYKCLNCGEKEIVNVGDWRRDGRTCKKCGGHLMPIGYAGVDYAKSKDKVAFISTPPGLKNGKFFGTRRTVE